VPAANPRVLVFTKTEGFRHASIPAAIAAVKTLGAQNGFDMAATEDGGAFTAANLARYDAVLFLLTTGDVLDAAEQAAFEGYVRAGGGYVGVHSASDTERDWPWYGRLVGAWSSGHPEIQQATLDVASPRDTSTAALPARWTRTDEWYSWLSSPRANGVHVLLSIDETTYQPREFAMGADHPLAWWHDFDGGRAWYTQLGHTEESYAEPLFLGHLLGGIRYATGGDAQPAPAVAPRIAALTTKVRRRRVVVTLRLSSCSPCTATLQVHGKTVRLRIARGVASGSSAALPAGRWRLTVVLADRSSGLKTTARRLVRVPR
jgi:type 1 glutamine amidotransferase